MKRWWNDQTRAFRLGLALSGVFAFRAWYINEQRPELARLTLPQLVLGCAIWMVIITCACVILGVLYNSTIWLFKDIRVVSKWVKRTNREEGTMAYVVGCWHDLDNGDVDLEMLCDEDDNALIFVHRIDAENYLDTADIDREMFVIEAPEGVEGVYVQ